MEAKELRLGNYIECFKKYAKGIHTVDLSTFSNVIYDEEEKNNLFKPIPLTEEWLVKFGFEKVYESSFRVKYDYMRDFRFGYDVNKALKNTPEGVSFRGDNYTNIKHVHQLQNLYYALTGKELILK